LTSNFSDIESLADEIEAIAPDSRLLRPVVSLGSGFRSTVLQDAGGTVYLLGRTASVAKGYRYEVALLPTIREYLPCAVPDPHVVSGPTEGFPGGILAYPGLGGCPMRWSDAGAGADGREQLAGDLGRFLAALHRVPQKALAGLEKRPSLTSRPELEAMRLETSGTLADHLEPGEMTRLDDWWDQLIASSVMQDFSAVLTHHDFWYENLLVGGEPPRLSGVLDWEHVRLSDPVVDLVPLTYLDVGFAEEVMTAYKNHGGTVDDSFRVRFANHRVLREFGGIRYSIRHNDRVELVASIDKLRQTRVTDARR
jgi:aminoglycoside phosphotransferase (APT) family kinase protein